MTGDTEGRLAALEAEVRELRDREEIRELRYRYHECINEGTTDEIPGLFAYDGSLDFGYLGATSGQAGITKFFSRVGDLLSFVRQFIHAHSISFEDDTVTGRSYLEAKSVSDGRAFFVVGRYDDQYIREDGRWKFARMEFVPVFTVPFDEGWAQDDLLQMGRR